MELQELVERISQWKLRQTGELPQVDGAAQSSTDLEDAAIAAESAPQLIAIPDDSASFVEEDAINDDLNMEPESPQYDEADAAMEDGLEDGLELESDMQNENDELEVEAGDEASFAEDAELSENSEEPESTGTTQDVDALEIVEEEN